MSRLIKNSTLKTNEIIAFWLSEFGRKYLNLLLIYKLLFLTVILFLKNDINFPISNIKEVYLPAANSLPKPIGYFSESLGNLLLARIFQVSSVQSWIILHIIILFIFLTILILIINTRKGLDKDTFILLIFTTPALSVVLQTIGNYDAFTFFGGLLFILLKSKKTVVFSIVLMGLGNPEQTILAVLCVYILSFVPNFKEIRSRCYLGLGISILFWCLIQIWMFTNGAPGTRIILIPHFIDLAVLSFWSNPIQNLWSYFGILWAVIIYCLVYFTKKNLKILLISIILLPLCATLLTADGVRVFSLINLPTLFILINWFNKEIVKLKYRNLAVGIYLTTWILIPSALYNNRTISDYVADILSKLAGAAGGSIVQIGLKIFS